MHKNKAGRCFNGNDSLLPVRRDRELVAIPAMKNKPAVFASWRADI